MKLTDTIKDTATVVKGVQKAAEVVTKYVIPVAAIAFLAWAATLDVTPAKKE